MNPIEISIVIPVFNSEDCLYELNKQIQLHLDSKVSYELILVNDKSKDKSWDKIVEVASVNANVKGVSLKKNSGQDNAIMAGLGVARGEYIIIMDDDLQHSPEDILKLHTHCRQGYDVCYALFPEKKQKGWKNVGSRMNGYLAGKILSKPPEIYLSPFKIIHRSVVREMVNYKGPYPYIDAIILTITSNITQIELEHQERFQGRSNYNLVRSVSVFIKHATGYSIYPLRVATFVGIISSLLSFVLAFFYVADYLLNEERVEGWITLVLLIVFFSGLILMCLGVIGEYVGRVYLTLNTRPQYIIDKVVGSKQ